MKGVLIMFRQKKFTLIELLVVIAIIAILAAILMPALSSARERGRSATCISNMKTFGVAISSYADDFVTYPWPCDKGLGLPANASQSAHTTIFCLLTGHDASGNKYSNSYIPPFGKGKSKKGSIPGIECPSHLGQTNAEGTTSPTLTAHYMFFASSDWQAPQSVGGCVGMTGTYKLGIKYSTMPQQVKSPGTKVAMVERTLRNIPISDTAYCITDRRYIYGGSLTNRLGPCHGGKSSGLHYDGHASMLDMEGEFYCSDDNRGTVIFRRYVNTREIY